MSESLESMDELRSLLARLCDGELDVSGYARIEQLVHGDSAARQLYIDSVLLHGELYWASGRSSMAASTEFESGEQEAETAELQSTAASLANPAAVEMSADRNDRLMPSYAKRSRRWPRWGAAIAAGLLIAAGIAFYQSARERSAFLSSDILEVAELKSSDGCTWAGKDGGIPDGTQLYLGERLELTAGVARLSFARGATVLVESPATFELLSASSMRLVSGTVAVRAAGPVKDFVIVSPDASIVDLGTSFGVHCEHGRATEVEVFEGAVEICRDDRTSDGRALGLGAFARIRRTDEDPEIEIAASGAARFEKLLDVLWDDFASDVGGSEGNAIAADFNEAPIPGTVDTFYGSARGRGWRTPWVAAGNPIGEIRHDDALSLDGGPYLRMSFHRAIGRIVGREYGSRSDFDPMRPHVISWKWRFDGDPEHFGRHFKDRVLFYASNRFSSNTGAANSWLIRLAAADEVDGRFRAGYPMHWCFFDSRQGKVEGRDFSRDNLVDSGMTLKSGVVYHFAVAVYPEGARYDVAIRDDEQTVIRSGLSFRNCTPGPANVIHFGTRSEDETANLAFSLDAVHIGPLEQGALREHLQ